MLQKGNVCVKIYTYAFITTEKTVMSDFMQLREKTVCFTGHRPEKLPDGGNCFSPATDVIKSMLYRCVKDSIDNGMNCFITGCARGVDLWAGEVLMEMRNKGADLHIIAAVPCRDYAKNFTGNDKLVFGELLSCADRIVYISEEYTKSCIRMRNEYMVNHSSRIIAVIGQSRSGTGQTLRMAERAGLDTVVIDSSSVKKLTLQNSEPEFVTTFIE